LKPTKEKARQTPEQPIPMLDLRAQFDSIEEDIRAAIERVLVSQHFVLGPELEALEREIAHYCQRRFGIGVASGTDAVALGLRACGVEPGDEVIVPAFTFVATAGAVSAIGARPVFADSEPDTLNVDPESVDAMITARTRAIVAVHLYGRAASMEPLLEVAARNGLPLVEDNAQSLGATYRGRKAGSFGAVAATSFYPSKTLGAYGDGGMIVTDSEKISTRLTALRNHGQTGRYVSIEPGFNSRLDEIQAAVLRVKLRHLDGWIALRQAHATRYTERLQSLEGVRTPETGPEHSCYLYTIRITSAGPNPAERRDHVARHLTELGIGTSVFYPLPLHLQPLYAALGGKPGQLPVAERAAQEVLSLPLYPEMGAAQVDRVADAVVNALTR
jgi:dTDP-4-amino-4,6-dideoxygalactose transaminase